VAVFLLVISYFRHSASFTRWLAPELGAAVLAANIFLMGASLVGALAIVLLAASRLLWLGRAVQRRIFRVPSASTEGSSGSAKNQPPPTSTST
jgi:hypothetical protein